MHVVILGNGIAGVSCARALRKRSSSVEVTVVSGESDHHFSRPALMYLYMGHMRFPDLKPYEDSFWTANRIALRRGWVETVDVGGRRLRFVDGTTLGFDALLLATGSIPNRFGWPGQDLERVQGMVSLQDLVALERATPVIEHGVVVGGGLIGIELAEMLHSRGRRVTLLVREEGYWGNVLPPEESALVERQIRQHGIALRLQTELSEILDDGQGGVGGVVLSSGERLSCQFVGLTAGVRPNLSVVADTPIEARRGIVVDEFLATNVEGIWAAGDCAEIRPTDGASYLQQVWYTGKAQGVVAAQNILGERARYVPGIWYNSAKFLDLEYQVYGEVPARAVEGRHHLYWEDSQAGRSLRIVHDDARRVCGIQSMGLRIRHRVCESWIREGTSVDQVRASLEAANFDPEFSRRFEDAVRAGLREVPL